MSALQGTMASPPEAQAAAAPRIAFRPHRELPWLVLPQGIPLQVLIDATPVQVPNTRSWFCGVVSQRGNLIPVFDLAEWAGYPSDTSQGTQIVAIGLGSQACALRCCEAPALLNIAEASVANALEGPLRPYAALAYDSALGKAHEFDVQQWLAAAATQVSAVG
jgi:CheW-like domain